jgi:hypothetical protein
MAFASAMHAGSVVLGLLPNVLYQTIIANLLCSFLNVFLCERFRNLSRRVISG